jgi:hypothetical protein
MSYGFEPCIRHYGSSVTDYVLHVPVLHGLKAIGGMNVK